MAVRHINSGSAIDADVCRIAEVSKNLPPKRHCPPMILHAICAPVISALKETKTLRTRMFSFLSMITAQSRKNRPRMSPRKTVSSEMAVAYGDLIDMQCV